MTRRTVNIVGTHGDFILSFCPSNCNDHETTCAASPSQTHYFFEFLKKLLPSCSQALTNACGLGCRCPNWTIV